MQTLANICIKRPVFATMLILALMVMGLASYSRLGVDLFPKIDFPIVSITTTLRGAAPEEVESQVTKRIEEAVNTISGIEELRSTSAEGISQVAIQFDLSKDPEVGAQEIRDQVAKVLNNLPRDADAPIIEKVATDAAPILSIVVASSRDLRETTKVVDDLIKKNIESLLGVGQVRFVGDRQRQIQLWLEGDKLYSYNLNVEQVRQAIQTQNVEIPGGRVEQARREVSLRTMGRVERPQDFNRIIIANSGGAPIRFSDIGTVVDGTEEARSLARLDGTPAVVLEVRKQAGTNTLDVIKSVKARTEELRKSMPADFKITYVRDQSTFIEESFEAVQAHLVEGAIFASIIVLLFMRNWRSTLIAAVAIPTSVISTYTLMAMMNFTLNTITMLALVLMVGIVIDDAIVVLENIFKNMEEKGLTAMEAAREGTREIGLAVLATTLSLVIVFLPVAMMSGIVGKFMSSFGYTAAFAIMVSLLVSFTLTPMLCSRFLKVKEGEHNSSKDTWIYKVLDRPYASMLRWSLRNRWVIITVSVVVFLSTVPLFNLIGKDFLPQDDQAEFEVSVRVPPGSSLDGTSELMKQIEAELKPLPGVRNLLTVIGADVRKQVDRGTILVELVPERDRVEKQLAIMDMARARLQRFHDVIIGVQPPPVIQGAGPNKALQFYLQGPDLNTLDGYASRIIAKLKATKGVADLESSYESGKPELRVRINRDKSSDLNVSVASIANAMRVLVGGDSQVTTYREGDDRIDVQLRVDEKFRNSAQALERLYVPSSSLGNVPVASVARLEEASGPIQIERFNRQRQILITANVVITETSLSEVIAELDKVVAELNLPPGYATGLIGGSREFGRAASNFLFAIGLSFAFMYMILAAQFESFLDPLIILLSLPMSVPFALISLMIFRENFSIIYSSVGILVLFGIVKKNSILQIDHIKNLRREGLPRLEAVIKGCEDRLRPILMTTAALVAGMIPLALGQGAGAGTRRTAAIIVIGGQTLCLLLTLLLTPVAYTISDDFATSSIWGRIGNLLSPSRWRRVITGATGLFGLLWLLCFAPPVAAQADRPELRLTLKDAIERGLKSNLEVEISRVNTQLQRAAARTALGVYDPTVRLSPGYERRTTPTPSVLQSPTGKLEDTFFNANASYNQRFRWNGTQFKAEFLNTRQTTNNPFVGLNPYTQSQLVLGITQPLLRGRETDRERTDLMIRNRAAQVSDIEFELKATDIVSRVQAAYWDLLSAQRDAQVKRDSVDYAQKQLEMNLRMIASGNLAAVERAASEAELERRKDSYLASVELITVLENNLKTLIAANREDELWRAAILPIDMEPTTTPPPADLDGALKQAIDKRLELKVLGLQRSSNDDQQKLARNLTKPVANLLVQWINTGLAGSINSTPNPFSNLNADLYQRTNVLSAAAGLPPLVPSGFGGPPPVLIGGYGTTLSNLFAGRFPTIQAGVTIDFTLRNNAAKGQLEQALQTERQLKLQTAQAEQLVSAEVRNAYQAIQTARQRITAADASARAAQEKLDSELRLFGTGESTNFLVLTRQNELADSRTRAIAARLNLFKAMVALSKATGGALEAAQVKLN
ncbi:MAG: efflux RND transporter permease subunit [Acidobacteria bacterium]|nr:efflux RND transporter permease subunit [Acidobacteriota bacterium]